MRASYDPKSPTIEVYRDELRDHATWLYYRQLAVAHGKELKVIRRPEPRPLNPLPVTRDELRDHRNFLALREKAEREGETLWVED